MGNRRTSVKHGLTDGTGLRESSLFLQSIELRATMAPWGPSCFKFSHHPTRLGQCSWISWDSASEPIDCSMPLATSFMPFYCLSYYPSCTKVQDQCDDYYQQIPGQENVSVDHTLHDILVADQLRWRQGIHWIPSLLLVILGN